MVEGNCKVSGYKPMSKIWSGALNLISHNDIIQNLLIDVEQRTKVKYVLAFVLAQITRVIMFFPSFVDMLSGQCDGDTPEVATAP
jgi:hypothetical protein